MYNQERINILDIPETFRGDLTRVVELTEVFKNPNIRREILIRALKKQIKFLKQFIKLECFVCFRFECIDVDFEIYKIDSFKYERFYKYKSKLSFSNCYMESESSYETVIEYVDQIVKEFLVSLVSLVFNEIVEGKI